MLLERPCSQAGRSHNRVGAVKYRVLSGEL